MKNTLRNLICTSLFAVTSLCAQQGLVIPQVADGDGWASTIVLTNTTADTSQVSLVFYSGGQAWTPPFLDGVNPASLSLPAASTLFISTTGTAKILTQGWAELTGAAAGAVVAYVIYTYTSGPNGQNTSQGTAQAVTTASRILVPFDNTGNLATEIAVVNPNPSQVSIQVNLKTSDGTVSTGTTLTMAGEGQMAFAMATQFPATKGQSGLAEFYANPGSFAIIALQANTNPATNVFSFTTAPVYPQTTESPIISSSPAGGGGGGGAIPAGDITFAGFSIGKITSAGIVTESVGGDFGAYTPQAWDPPYEGTKFAPYCNVWGVSYTLGQPFPAAPGFYLDAGPSLSLSGPPPLAANTTLPAANIPNFVGPDYLLQLPQNTLVDGGTYTLSGPGGTQVDSFKASATLPLSFSTNASEINSVSRSQPLTISWTGSGFEGITIGVIGSTLSGATFTEKVLSCAVPASLGTYSVPTLALSLLPATPAGTLTVGTLPAAPATSGPPATLTPGLAAGGKIQYGAFTPSYAVAQIVAIQ
jgi:hypothetical protein